MTKETRRRLRAAVLGRFLRLLATLLAGQELPAVQRFGRLLGALTWHLSRRDRQRALDHLELAMPELDAEQRRRLARRVFAHQGMNLAEVLRLLSADCRTVAEAVEMVGWEEVDAARRRGQPIVVVTGHCGNWELLAAALNCRGLGMRVVGRRLDDPELQGLLLDARSRFGSETIERASPGAARMLLTTLREGGALGMLIDQDTRVEGVWVPFFGQPAHTPVGAAKIALKQRAAVLPIFIERLPDGGHRAVIHPALELPDERVAATARMTAAIEEQVRRVPEQWVWMHRRWRRQPPAGSC